MAPTPTRLYPDGPVRLFSTDRFLGGTPYNGGSLRGFVGQFVCGQCKLEVPRVLFSLLAGDWLCRDCETAWKRAEAALSATRV